MLSGEKGRRIAGSVLLARRFRQAAFKSVCRGSFSAQPDFPAPLVVTSGGFSFIFLFFEQVTSERAATRSCPHFSPVFFYFHPAVQQMVDTMYMSALGQGFYCMPTHAAGNVERQRNQVMAFPTTGLLTSFQ